MVSSLLKVSGPAPCLLETKEEHCHIVDEESEPRDIRRPAEGPQSVRDRTGTRTFCSLWKCSSSPCQGANRIWFLLLLFCSKAIPGTNAGCKKKHFREVPQSQQLRCQFNDFSTSSDQTLSVPNAGGGQKDLTFPWSHLLPPFLSQPRTQERKQSRSQISMDTRESPVRNSDHSSQRDSACCLQKKREKMQDHKPRSL